MSGHPVLSDPHLYTLHRDGCYTHPHLVCSCDATGIYTTSDPIEVGASHQAPVAHLHPAATMLVHLPHMQVADCDMSNEVVHSLTPPYAVVDSTPSASKSVTVRGWMFDWDTKDQIKSPLAPCINMEDPC